MSVDLLFTDNNLEQLRGRFASVVATNVLSLSNLTLHSSNVEQDADALK